MSQNIHGIRLTNGVYILYGRGVPSSRPDIPELFSAQIGSTYRRTDGVAGGILFVCTGNGVPPTGANAGTLSTWTAYA
jgi:hypothetical protein